MTAFSATFFAEFTNIKAKSIIAVGIIELVTNNRTSGGLKLTLISYTNITR